MQIKDYQIFFLGLTIALGCVFSTYILSKSIVEFQKMQNQTIRVTGSASQNVTSDFASWTINFKTKQTTLKECYATLNSDEKKIKNFLISNGIDEKSIEFEAINSYENYKTLPNGKRTNEVESYSAWQSAVIKSKDINKITDISKKVDILINQDINLTANGVQYFVTNLDDIKIKMVGEASKNAKKRAQSMIKGTNGKIGVMNSAKMGVFQIVPVNSTEVSDYGYNDTSSLEKKVVATVSASFTVK
ncbi:MAG: SIMPL domain-containing protein [Candidatus Gastranaerophilales bacterium]|nr:SIMPL domain-containing protein [Candidatus Gastranaerophilales bacterium]